MPLVLGPVLRHVGETSATVWVQTDRPASVSILGCTAQTFEVSGHHYALVRVTGLEPGRRVPYEVEIDGERVWPPATTPFPPSTIPTRQRESHDRQRIIFGSCRYAKVADPRAASRLGIDALDAYAARLTTLPHSEWPDALLLLGDQVYADELTPRNRRRIAGRRERHPEWPDDEIVSFDEYAGLYCDAWTDPEIRWLMSTVPTAMIFDDHDVRDDWNTSGAWRVAMSRKPWWRERIRAALASYWVYQHLGNLPSDDLAADPDYRKVVEHDGDAWPLLVEIADRADAESDGEKGLRFSFQWEFGRVRLLMIDSRNGRILDGEQRLMLGDREFAWIEQQATAPGAVDHVVIGTSLPWLLPPAIADLETLNETAAARPGRRGWLAEVVRQAGDLEHWSAFRASFGRLTALISRVAAAGPATVNVLSGDVHHSYVARAELPDDPPAPVYQLTCSPVHNKIHGPLRPVFRFAWSRAAHRLTARWARRAGVPPLPVTWNRVVGPLFGNMIATLDIDGRNASVSFEQPRTAATLVEHARLDLTNR